MTTTTTTTTTDVLEHEGRVRLLQLCGAKEEFISSKGVYSVSTDGNNCSRTSGACQVAPAAGGKTVSGRHFRSVTDGRLDALYQGSPRVRRFSKSHGFPRPLTQRIGRGFFKTSRVGSDIGDSMFRGSSLVGSGRVGSGRVSQPYPTRPVRSQPTLEKTAQSSGLVWYLLKVGLTAPKPAVSWHLWRGTGVRVEGRFV